MSISDQQPFILGTRFRLFPQAPYLQAYAEPETVYVAVPAGTMAPGPADDRLYVVDPLYKAAPYGQAGQPPYRGAIHPPVMPGPDGHFDHLPVDSRAFRAAHAYGAVRFTLDVWQRYFGHRIEWFFSPPYPRLELIPDVDWDNAQAGMGFIELGYGLTDAGEIRPHSLNFDVLAHELGHIMLFSEIGYPPFGRWTSQYRSFHESSSDLIALLTVLQFNTVVDHLLETTEGNLYVHNELNRIGELSETEQIRLASNSLKMSDLTPDMRDHGRSLPLTGAVFDILVEIYQQELVQQGLISPQLAELSYGVPEDPRLQDFIQQGFSTAYHANPEAFKRLLLQTRDYVGTWLAESWRRLDVRDLTFFDVASALVSTNIRLSGDRYDAIVRESLDWRQIDFQVVPGLAA